MILPGIGATGVGAVIASGGGSGGGVGGVAITDRPLVAVGVGAPQKATYRLNTSGVAEKGKNATFTTLETWLLTGASSDYDALAHDNLSTITGGSALDTWLNLGTTRSWELSDVSAGDGGETGEIAVSIRQAVSPFTVLATATISLYAEAY